MPALQTALSSGIGPGEVGRGRQVEQDLGISIPSGKQRKGLENKAQLEDHTWDSIFLTSGHHQAKKKTQSPAVGLGHQALRHLGHHFEKRLKRASCCRIT